MKNEKRLIYADELSKKVNESKYNNSHSTSLEMFNHRLEHDHFLQMIIDSPTVDAVEVVRCKDCAFYDRFEKVDRDRGYCLKYGFGCMRIKKLEDFCSYGERRNNE